MRHTATIIIWGYIPTASVVPIQQTNVTKGKKMYQLEYLILQNVFNAKPKGEIKVLHTKLWASNHKAPQTRYS